MPSMSVESIITLRYGVGRHTRRLLRPPVHCAAGVERHKPRKAGVALAGAFPQMHSLCVPGGLLGGVVAVDGPLFNQLVDGAVGDQRFDGRIQLGLELVLASASAMP